MATRAHRAGADSDRDRQAVEQIMGRPLSQEWPAHAIAAESRVRVAADSTGHIAWQREFFGVVSPMGAPEPVINPQAHDGELAYWVAFDEPQLDSDGDGPYRKALIWDRYITPVRS